MSPSKTAVPAQMTAIPPPFDGEKAPLGGRWRGFLFFVPLVVWVLVGAGLIGIWAGFSKRARRGSYGYPIRLWGSVPLRLCGIRLEVHGKERLDQPGAKLVLFNHVSLLDLFVLASQCKDGALVLYKKEFEKVPGIGRALQNLGMIPVDRRDLESAIASVRTASERILENQSSCFISPEGTRSRKGGLQKFKKGAFHLAAEYGIPILPMVMRGIDRVLPMSSFIPRSGVIRIDFLEQIDASEWESIDVRRHAKEVREIFLQYLPAAKEDSA